MLTRTNVGGLTSTANTRPFLLVICQMTGAPSTNRLLRPSTLSLQHEHDNCTCTCHSSSLCISLSSRFLDSRSSCFSCPSGVTMSALCRAALCGLHKPRTIGPSFAARQLPVGKHQQQHPFGTCTLPYLQGSFGLTAAAAVG